MTQSGRVSRRPERFIEVERNGDGLNQVGRLLDLTHDVRSEVEAHVKGKFVFKQCLKPAGWTTPRSDKLYSDNYFMLLAKGAPALSAVEGTQKFYSYDALWYKWKSDEDFRKMYPGGQDVQQTLKEFLCGATEPSSETECPASNGLARSTQAVPPAPGDPAIEVVSTTTQHKATSDATKKRARGSKSKQKSKRAHFSSKRLGNGGVKKPVSRKEQLERAHLAHERTTLLEAIENEKLKKQLAMLRNPDEEISAEKKQLDWEHEREQRKQKIAELRKDNECK